MVAGPAAADLLLADAQLQPRGPGPLQMPIEGRFGNRRLELRLEELVDGMRRERRGCSFFSAMALSIMAPRWPGAVGRDPCGAGATRPRSRLSRYCFHFRHSVAREGWRRVPSGKSLLAVGPVRAESDRPPPAESLRRGADRAANTRKRPTAHGVLVGGTWRTSVSSLLEVTNGSLRQRRPANRCETLGKIALPNNRWKTCRDHQRLPRPVGASAAAARSDTWRATRPSPRGAARCRRSAARINCRTSPKRVRQAVAQPRQPTPHGAVRQRGALRGPRPRPGGRRKPSPAPAAARLPIGLVRAQKGPANDRRRPRSQSVCTARQRRVIGEPLPTRQADANARFRSGRSSRSPRRSAETCAAGSHGRETPRSW